MAKKSATDSMKKDLDSFRDGAYIPTAKEDGDLTSYEEGEDALTTIWKDWELTRDYLNSRNVPNCIRMYEDYYQDKQWKYMPKSLPNICFNVIAAIIKQKQSTICESPIQLDYFTNSSSQDSQEITRFIAFLLKTMGFEKALRSAVKWSLVRMNDYLHFYWNEDAIGQDANAKGACKVERIHVLNIGMCNPTVKNIQDQEWVIIATREKVERAKRMCQFKDEKDKIVHDDNEINDEVTEQDDNSLCTVLTRYFRINGEVYFEKATKFALLTKPTPLNPNLTIQEIRRKRQKRDPETSKNPDEHLEDMVYEEQTNKFFLYPIVDVCLNESSDSYLGISDIEGMVAPQNAVNVMYSLAVQNGIVLQPKYLKKPDALRGEVITNEIGQVLTDHHKGGGDGVKILTGVAQYSDEMLNTPLAMIETLKKVKSSADVTMGDVSKEYSATAISLLQTAAEKPTEDMERQKELAAEEAGKILLLFAKFYYRNARYAYDITEQEQMAMADSYQLPREAIPMRQEGRFFGNKFINNVCDIQVSAGAGGKLSQATQFQFLIQFFQLSGNMTPDQKRAFIKATPNYIFSDKDQLLALVDAEEQGVIAQMQQEIAKLEQAINTYDIGTKEMATIIDYLKKYINYFQKSAGEQIDLRDKKIAALTNGQSGQEMATQLSTQAGVAGGNGGQVNPADVS